MLCILLGISPLMLEDGVPCLPACASLSPVVRPGTGLQTFLLYLGPHIARFTLKATACGRSDLKSAPYDTALWGASDSWTARSCSELGPPVYPHFPGRHGGYYAVPLLHLLLAMLPEAMLWGAGTAIGELPPFLVARAGAR